MKKRFIAMALLLCLALGTLTGAHLWVNSARDQVEVGETVLAGDPAAAAGASITLRSRDREGFLSWDTTFTPGGAEAAETNFRFSSKAAEPDMSWANRPVATLDQAFPLGISIGGSVDLEACADPARSDVGTVFFAKLAAVVAENTEPGEKHTETLRLIDYFDHYPLSFNANWNYINGNYDTESNGYLAQYFRIPVEEDQWMEITVTKDSSGGVADITGNTDPTAPFLWSESVATEDGVYLAVRAKDTEDRPTDALQCRDGQGIHFVPLAEEEFNWFNPAGFRLFYPTEEEILHLHASGDASWLMLYTREAGKLVLTMIDRATGEAVQRLELTDLPEDSMLEPIDQGDLHLVALVSGDFFLLQEGPEGVSVVLTGKMDRDDRSQSSLLGMHQDPTLAWDGERLVWTSEEDRWENRLSGAGRLILYAGVWDGEGLQFLGQYRFSPFRDPAAVTRLAYQTAETDAVSIAFS